MAAQVAIERAERSAQIQANGIIPHRGLTAPEQSLDEKDKLINQVRGIDFGYKCKIMKTLIETLLIFTIYTGYDPDILTTAGTRAS